MRGIRTDGIRTIEDLKDRCVIDEITGCWIWKYAVVNGQPKMWFAPTQRVVTLGVVIGTLKTGKAPARGEYWHINCETRCCANPDHRECGTRSTQMLAANIRRSPLQMHRMNASARERITISEEVVEQIRSSSEIARVLSERHNVSTAHIWRIRHGTARKPLTVNASSVFNWRPT